MLDHLTFSSYYEFANRLKSRRMTSDTLRNPTPSPLPAPNGTFPVLLGASAVFGVA